jgi:hypothetical protein
MKPEANQRPGAKLIKLNYGLTDRPDRPVEVERVPDGELV